MTQFTFTAGQSGFFEFGKRIGWSVVDSSVPYGSASASPITDAKVPVVECYYDVDAQTLNATVGASANLFAVFGYFQGAYNDATTYTPGQVAYIFPAGIFTAYECIQTTTPGRDPFFNPTYWVPLVTTTWRGPVPLPSVGTSVFAPPPYDPAVTYYAGSIVVDLNVQSYTSPPTTLFVCQSTTTGNAPESTPTAYWSPWFFQFSNPLYRDPVHPGGLLPASTSLPVPLEYLELKSVAVAGTGLYATPYGSQFTNASPHGATRTAETELGPGFVRYSWPCAPNLFKVGTTYTITVS